MHEYQQTHDINEILKYDLYTGLKWDWHYDACDVSDDH